MPVLPPAIAWALGAIGAAVLARLLVKEWQRVNAELDQGQRVPINDSERAGSPTLRRDPATGVYRVHRK
jgi:hypothetical protein